MSSDTKSAAPADFVGMAAENMRHELMDIALAELKLGHEPWQKRNMFQQDEVIQRVSDRVRDAVESAIHTISSNGFVRMPAKIDSVMVKDGFKAVLTLAQTEPGRHDLVDAQGTMVTIVLANVSAFVDAPHAHKPMKDQPELDLPTIVPDEPPADGDYPATPMEALLVIGRDPEAEPDQPNKDG